jgi:hypothetical protein
MENRASSLGVILFPLTLKPKFLFFKSQYVVCLINHGLLIKSFLVKYHSKSALPKSAEHISGGCPSGQKENCRIEKLYQGHPHARASPGVQAIVEREEIENQKVPVWSPTGKARACTLKRFGAQAWYLHVLRRNPPKHTLQRTRLRRVILFAFIHGHRPWSSA